MNVFLLYLILLKAVVTSFSGLTSLPMVREDLVVRRHVLTDRELNAAVVAGRSGPGPYGLYVVSVGYFVAGIPGAIAGLLAVATPAFLVIPMARYLGTRAQDPRVRSAIQAMTIAAAALIVSSTLPLARDAITGPLPAAIAIGAFVVLTFTKLDVFWVIVGSGMIGLVASL